MESPEKPNRCRTSLAEGLILSGFLIASLVYYFPLTLHLGGRTLANRMDIYLFIWDLWYVRLATLTSGISLFHTDLLFHPQGTGLVYHTLAPLDGLLALPFQAAGGLIFAYNSMLVLATALSGYCAYLLARELFGTRQGRLPALVAGTAFGFCTARWVSTIHGHLSLISTWWIPLYLLFLARLLRRGRRRDALLAGAAAAAILYTDYQLFVFALYWSALLLVPLWAEIEPRRSWRGLLTGSLLLLLVLLVLASPLLAGAAGQRQGIVLSFPAGEARGFSLTLDTLFYDFPSQHFWQPGAWAAWRRSQGEELGAGDAKVGRVPIRSVEEEGGQESGGERLQGGTASLIVPEEGALAEVEGEAEDEELAGERISSRHSGESRNPVAADDSADASGGDAADDSAAERDGGAFKNDTLAATGGDTAGEDWWSRLSGRLSSGPIFGWTLALVALAGLALPRRLGGGWHYLLWWVPPLFFAWMALGPHPTFLGHPFPGLYNRFHPLPVLGSLRAVYRFSIPMTLGVALVAAASLRGWLERLRAGARPPRGRNSGPGRVLLALLPLLPLLIFLEFLRIPVPVQRLPQPPDLYRSPQFQQRFAGRAVLELPLWISGGDFHYGLEAREQLYYQTFHGLPLVGGHHSRLAESAVGYFTRRPGLMRLTEWPPGGTFSEAEGDDLRRAVEEFGVGVINLSRTHYSPAEEEALIAFLKRWLDLEPLYTDRRFLAWAVRGRGTAPQ